MRHVTAAFAVEAKLVLDDLVGEAEEERIAVGLVVVRVPSTLLLEFSEEPSGCFVAACILRITLPRETKVVAVDREVDVFGEPFYDWERWSPRSEPAAGALSQSCRRER